MGTNEGKKAKRRDTIWDAYQLTNELHWRGTKNEDHAQAHMAGIVLTLGKDYPVEGITGEVVSSLVAQWKRKGLANATVNRKLAALGRVLRTAHQAGMRSTPPPQGLRLKEGRGRRRVVTRAELNRVVNEMVERARTGDDFQAGTWAVAALLVEFLHETGMRVGEALALTTADVPDGGGSATVKDSKSGEPRTVPLTGAAAAVVRERRNAAQVHQGYLFPILQSSFNAAWNQVKVAIGLWGDAEFVPHALRHTCATNLVKAGVPVPVVQKWLGHKSIQTTMRYAHVNDGQLNDAARALEGK